MRLQDRVAVVTGGGLGIGAAYARGLAREGAAVVVADIDQAAAEAIAEEIRIGGGQALAVKVDVTSGASTDAMAKAAADAFGHIDVLINNAGVYSALKRKSFEQISEEEWDWVFAVNTKSVWLCAKSCLPFMKERGGSVVNISSSTVWLGLPIFMHYIAAKAAVVGLTRSLSRALGEYSIRVNCVAPGLTKTGRNEVPEEMWNATRQNRALKRDQVPEDLVGTILWLASDDSAFVTGQTILVDGGLRYIG